MFLLKMMLLLDLRLKNSSSNVASTPVSDAGVTPYIIVGENSGGNITCEEAAAAFGVDGFAYTTGKVDYNGSFEGSFEGFTVTTDGTNVTWSFTAPEGYCLANMAVIVKGGADANVYFYGSELYGDSGLASPVNASGSSAGLSNLTFCYNLVECVVEECVWEGETAFGGSTEGAGSAWWFAFDTAGDAVQPIYAGQKPVEGAFVEYDAVNDVITIVLGENMKLEDVTETTSVHPRTGAVKVSVNDEQVKVQGYNVLPTSRPAAGLFSLYKGRELTIQGNGSAYYVIHLDVEVKVCE
jgi:hypothetical protein